MDLPPKLIAIAAAQGGPFTTAQARQAGCDDRELRRLLRFGSLVRLRHGVYLKRTLLPDDEAGQHVMKLRAVLLCLKAPLAASHQTAATLHLLAMLDPDLSQVHITREDAGSSRTEAGVRHHDASLPVHHLTEVDGIVTTTPARASLDIARTSTFEAALVVVESALNKGLATLSEFREILAHCTDWPGGRMANRAITFATPYSESPGESLSRIAFDVLGLPPPCQQTLFFDDAGFIARSDFYWVEHNTIGEFDGLIKYTSSDKPADVVIEEKRREDRLRDAGAEIFRIGWLESLHQSPSIRRKALAAFDRAARSNTPPSYRYRLQPPPS
jgi:Transcriptional regulator, AbiEi antitoxin